MPSFNPIDFRAQFPALAHIGTYLDSAASSLKCRAMIDAVQHYYLENGVNIERGHYSSAQQTADAITQSRQAAAHLIHAASPQQIIWTSGATAALNLVATSYLAAQLQSGDEIIVSVLEHHSNLLPWIMLAQRYGATIIPWNLNAEAKLDLDDLRSLINHKTRLVAVTQMSNVTGYQPELNKIVPLLKQHHIPIVVDGAQGIVHQPINVQELDVDFYAYSAHKLYASMGVGVLYIKQSHLSMMHATQGGGKMLTSTSMHDFTPADLPARLEAGTLNLAGILGFGATLDWLQQIDLSAAQRYTEQLADQAEQALLSIANITLYRAAHSPIISFNIAGQHPNDIATLLAEQNIAIRHGEHCAQPLMAALNISGCLRISLAPYNTSADIQRLMSGLQQALLILE